MKTIHRDKLFCVLYFIEKNPPGVSVFPGVRMLYGCRIRRAVSHEKTKRHICRFDNVLACQTTFL
jgi:hypothetical protein